MTSMCGKLGYGLVSIIGLWLFGIFMFDFDYIQIAKIGIRLLGSKHGGFVDDGRLIGDYNTIQAKDAPNSIVNLMVQSYDIFHSIPPQDTMILHGNIIHIDWKELSVFVVSCEHILDSKFYWRWSQHEILNIFAYLSPTLNLSVPVCHLFARNHKEDIGFYKCVWDQDKFEDINILRSKLKNIKIASFNPFYKIKHGIDSIKYYFMDYNSIITTQANVFSQTPVFDSNQYIWTKNWSLNRWLMNLFAVGYIKQYFNPKIQKEIDNAYKQRRGNPILFVIEGTTSFEGTNGRLYHENAETKGFSGNSMYNVYGDVIALIEAFEDNWFFFYGAGLNRATKLNNDFFVNTYEEITGKDLRKMRKNGDQKTEL